MATGEAGAFGFSMTYPRDNPWGIIYEPWHWSLKRSGSKGPAGSSKKSVT